MGAKLVLPVGGRPMVRVVDAASARASSTVLVVGNEAEEVLEAVAGRPVTVVVNPD
jgi:CTP:molybdopterin cytidylyltransferase MocA